MGDNREGISDGVEDIREREREGREGAGRGRGVVREGFLLDTLI